MQVNSIDQEQNLFRVENFMPPELVRKILATDWPSLPWKRQEGQENWARRRIDDTAIPWIQEWNIHRLAKHQQYMKHQRLEQP